VKPVNLPRLRCALLGLLPMLPEDRRRLGSGVGVRLGLRARSGPTGDEAAQLVVTRPAGDEAGGAKRGGLR
jgi:hypothetical protein